jgi:hypothetical protein
MTDLYNHKTQDGLTPIVMLEDTHLLNIIHLHLRSIENARLLLEQKEKSVNTVVAALYRNQPQADPQQIISKAHETLMPYVLEATMRGLCDAPLVLQMQAAYGYAPQQNTIEASSTVIPF